MTLFYGTIQTVDDGPLGEPDIGVVSGVSSADFQEVTTRRIMSATYATGNLLKGIVNHIVTDVVEHLQHYTRSRHAGWPAIKEQQFDLVTVEAASESSGEYYRLVVAYYA